MRQATYKGRVGRIKRAVISIGCPSCHPTFESSSSHWFQLLLCRSCGLPSGESWVLQDQLAMDLSAAVLTIDELYKYFFQKLWCGFFSTECPTSIWGMRLVYVVPQPGWAVLHTCRICQIRSDWHADDPLLNYFKK